MDFCQFVCSGLRQKTQTPCYSSLAHLSPFQCVISVSTILDYFKGSLKLETKSRAGTVQCQIFIFC